MRGGVIYATRVIYDAGTAGPRFRATAQVRGAPASGLRAVIYDIYVRKRHLWARSRGYAARRRGARCHPSINARKKRHL
jgi:hypothetical protein